MNKIHYPSLNFLRGFAALIVVVHHTEQLKFIHGYPNVWNNQAIETMGKLSVDLFFVLSGFLITSLLFIEKEIAEGISIKKFLMRRILRIWPVYFLVVIVAFFITPHIPFLAVGKPYVSIWEHFGFNLFLYVLFLPHVQSLIVGPLIYCSQLWSIGIEEYFYIFWPFVVKKLAAKNILYFIFVFVVGYIAFCVLSKYINAVILPNSVVLKSIRSWVIDELKFDCLLIGSFFGIINYNLKRNNLFITSRVFQISLYLLEIALWASGFGFRGFFWEIHALIFGLIILNLVRQTSILRLEHPVFDFLGRISYGIYMYHMLIANIAILIVFNIGCSILLYPIIFVAVISLSFLSYRYFELPFLKKKVAYSTIKTGY